MAGSNLKNKYDLKQEEEKLKADVLSRMPSVSKSSTIRQSEGMLREVSSMIIELSNASFTDEAILTQLREIKDTLSAEQHQPKIDEGALLQASELLSALMLKKAVLLAHSIFVDQLMIDACVPRIELLDKTSELRKLAKMESEERSSLRSRLEMLTKRIELTRSQLAGKWKDA